MNPPLLNTLRLRSHAGKRTVFVHSGPQSNAASRDGDVAISATNQNPCSGQREGRLATCSVVRPQPEKHSDFGPTHVHRDTDNETAGSGSGTGRVWKSGGAGSAKKPFQGGGWGVGGRG